MMPFRMRPLLLFIILFSACSVQKTIQKHAHHAIFKEADLKTAHIGISIFDPEKNQYLYNYQADKFFLPASNTKLFTCYAAMKYLGDSIKGLRYHSDASSGITWVRPTGDPTLLHPDFQQQRVVDFLRINTSSVYALADLPFQTTALGSGWSWNDYQQNYMAERSAFPVYGNLIWIRYRDSSIQWYPSIIKAENGSKGDYTESLNRRSNMHSFRRSQHINTLLYTSSTSTFRQQQIPFITSDTFSAKVLESEIKGLKWMNSSASQFKTIPAPSKEAIRILYSQPTDSVLRPMMHQSDNFFAEQMLLMVSDEILGVMNDRKVIDTILKMNFSELSQKPNWVDGSGLSRYNLFTPRHFISLLQKMKAEFSWDRITTILPTGGTGTLNNFYKPLQYKIFAKTGTLSGQVALSGYLITKKNRKLIFSVLVNNHQTSAVTVRKAVEAFLMNLHAFY
ncbi:MAG: D-alanyl-D-alanine carboxypeptidase/D-alanyl-D-alanine-endopeptidase [Chitinophagaceae bacterium]|nr:D-alanyl-D-alanine carboxypeptidase/D-alanyl-D-alanine-endopeptidase [Chitinophagaceae bacterium]